MKHRLFGLAALAVSAVFASIQLAPFVEGPEKVPRDYGSKISAFLPLAVVFGLVLLIGGQPAYARLIDETDRPTKPGWVVIVLCLAAGLALALVREQMLHSLGYRVS